MSEKPTDYTVPTLDDSGERQQYATGAVRDLATGKGRYDLISPIALRRLALRAWRLREGKVRAGQAITVVHETPTQAILQLPRFAAVRG